MYTEDEKKLIVRTLLKPEFTEEDKLILKMRRIIEDQENTISRLQNDISLIVKYAKPPSKTIRK